MVFYIWFWSVGIKGVCQHRMAVFHILYLEGWLSSCYAMTRIGKYMAGRGQGQSSLASSASCCLSMTRIVLVFSAVGGSYGDASLSGEDDLHSTLPAPPLAPHLPALQQTHVPSCGRRPMQLGCWSA